MGPVKNRKETLLYLTLSFFYLVVHLRAPPPHFSLFVLLTEIENS